MSINPKFFYIEDDTAILFASNGTALAAILVGLPDVLPLIDFPLPTYPMWIYFLGLIFAFMSKSVIQVQNGDMRQREKLQANRDWIMSANENPDTTEEFKVQLQLLWEKLDKTHSKLLKEHHGPRLDKLRAIFFFVAGLCFLIGTASLISLASYAKAPGS